MTDPTGRALHLLSLLQTHRWWRAAELADRLEVTERTVRRDIDRLRDLGYPVDATTGRFGGYRLASGAHLPPLILDDDEAVAVAVGLRYAAEADIGGFEETSLHALLKIEQLLPHRLRRRVSALHANVASLRRATPSTDRVDPEVLGVLAAACRDREDVRFGYRRRDGHDSPRLVQPHQLVTAGRRWYLVAWDRHRDDWRTFRLDRIHGPRAVGSRFPPRPIPGGDAVRFLARSLGSLPRPVAAKLAAGAGFAALEQALRGIAHAPIEQAADSCTVLIGGGDLDELAVAVARIALTAPVTVLEPAELADIVARLGAGLSAAAPDRRGHADQLRAGYPS
ncbi:helix-turn-helix transcriptional regulator [Nocardia sp. NPDC057353]|uniref:helix-turn-helix transcriptional regulator n=1 Tax=Nocardia sp. NPDC057353 TaxID=3346104 RepID=UPI003629C43C